MSKARVDSAGRRADDRRGGGKKEVFPAKMPLHDGNHLIDSLPPEDRAALLEIAQPFDFPLGHVFCQSGDRAGHVEFIETGVVSAVTAMADGRTVESYMIGREGATHPLAHEASARCYARLVGQIAGSGRRVEVARLRALAQQRPAIRDMMTAYAVRLINELEQSTACNALHRAERRFAKWLLRCHDRAEGDELQLTQEFLASMLGAQRTTVNEAAQHLQETGAIRYVRGRIQILDRVALERAACECYAVQRLTLDEVTGAERDGEG